MSTRKIGNTTDLRKTISTGCDVQVRAVSKSNDGRVYFKGWANKFNLPDSYNTRIDIKTMNTERYRSNPLLLVNHDVDKVVGMATSCDQKDEGLWVEGFISASTAPHVTYVRDMVLEGCLRGLSIRFGGNNIKMEPDPDHENCELIRYSELMEISIVSIPAQPESLLSLRSLSMSKVRGMKAADCIKKAIVSAASNGVTEEDIMERLRDKSGLEAGALSQALDGKVTPMPETLLAAAVDVLGCDSNELKNYDAEDVEAAKEPTQTPADVAPEPPAERAEGDVQDCVSKKIPKLIAEGKPQDQAVAIAIQMCSEERGVEIDPSDDELKKYVEVARQATQEPGPTEPVEHEPVNDNPMLEKLDKLGELLTALVVEVKGLKEAMTIDAQEDSGKDKPASEMSSDEEESDSESEDEGLDEETERMLADRFSELERKASQLGLI